MKKPLFTILLKIYEMNRYSFEKYQLASGDPVYANSTSKFKKSVHTLCYLCVKLKISF